MSDEQKILADLAHREVYVNMSSLVYELSKVVYDIPYNRDSEINEENIRELLYVPGAPAEAGWERGFDVVQTPDGAYVWYDRDNPTPFVDHPPGIEIRHVTEPTDTEDVGGYWDEDGPWPSAEVAIQDAWRYGVDMEEFCTESEAWDDCCRTNDIDLAEFDTEVYEHWAVSPFLARKLTWAGEKVVDFCNFGIWCRTCTGQALWLDCCFTDIAKDMGLFDAPT
jgi:hypothetical protein